MYDFKSASKNNIDISSINYRDVYIISTFSAKFLQFVVAIWLNTLWLYLICVSSIILFSNNQQTYRFNTRPIQYKRTNQNVIRYNMYFQNGKRVKIYPCGCNHRNCYWLHGEEMSIVLSKTIIPVFWRKKLLYGKQYLVHFKCRMSCYFQEWTNTWNTVFSSILILNTITREVNSSK